MLSAHDMEHHISTMKYSFYIYLHILFLSQQLLEFNHCIVNCIGSTCITWSSCSDNLHIPLQFCRQTVHLQIALQSGEGSVHEWHKYIFCGVTARFDSRPYVLYRLSPYSYKLQNSLDGKSDCF